MMIKYLLISIVDASQWCFGDYLRNLFANMILTDSLSIPEHVWEQTRQILSKDIEDKKRVEYNNPGLYFEKPVLNVLKKHNIYDFHICITLFLLHCRVSFK